MAEAFKQAFFDRGEPFINGSALLDRLGYAEWLENTRKNSSAQTVRADWVVAYTFFAFREDDGRMIGLTRVMPGCYSDNLASNKTIEKCGGTWTETKQYPDGHVMNIYWITL